MFVSIQELVALATSQNKSISEVMIEQEMEMTQQSREFIWAKMEKNLQTMIPKKTQIQKNLIQKNQIQMKNSL